MQRENFYVNTISDDGKKEANRKEKWGKKMGKIVDILAAPQHCLRCQLYHSIKRFFPLSLFTLNYAFMTLAVLWCFCSETAHCIRNALPRQRHLDTVFTFHAMVFDPIQ